MSKQPKLRPPVIPGKENQRVVQAIYDDLNKQLGVTSEGAVYHSTFYNSSSGGGGGSADGYLRSASWDDTTGDLTLTMQGKPTVVVNLDGRYGTGSGDITEVTTAANSGLSGGATSGAVALALSLAGLNAHGALAGTDEIALTNGTTVTKIPISGLDLSLMDNTGSNFITTAGVPPTNLGVTQDALQLVITSSTGSDATLPLASSLNVGIMSVAQHDKLEGLSGDNFYLTGATWNSTNGVITFTVNGATNPTVDIDGRYAYYNARTDGYIWVRRNSTSSALFATQQGTGPVAQFYQGAGDGTVVATINNEGVYQGTVGVQAPVFGTSGITAGSTNADHIWHDDAGNIWHMVSDGTIGTTLGNTNLRVGTINTGIGATEVHLMDQNVRTTDGVTFATVNTGHGANELYPMNQAVRTSDNVEFNEVQIDASTGSLYLRIRSSDGVGILTKTTTGGWARGFAHYRVSDSVRSAGFGWLGSNETVSSFNVGWGTTWYNSPVLRVTETQAEVTGNLAVTGAGTIGGTLTLNSDNTGDSRAEYRAGATNNNNHIFYSAGVSNYLLQHNANDNYFRLYDYQNTTSVWLHDQDTKTITFNVKTQVNNQLVAIATVASSHGTHVIQRNSTMGSFPLTTANAVLRIAESTTDMYLDGNAIGVTGSDFFLGTISNASIVFGTNNVERLRLSTTDFKHKDFTAGWTGTNWQITNSGDMEVENLVVRGSLKAFELIIKQISTIGGTEILSVGAGIAESVTGYGAGTGEVSVSTGSTTVSGTSTLFGTEIVVGDVIVTDTEEVIGEIASVLSATLATLTANSLVTHSGLFGVEDGSGATTGREIVKVEDPRGFGGNSFEQGDLVLVQQVDLNDIGGTVVKREYRRVSLVSGINIYLEPDGTATDVIEKGDAVVVYGNDTTASRQNIIYRNVEGSPIVRLQKGISSKADLATSPENTTKVAYGDLNGYAGLTSEEFGFYAGDYNGGSGNYLLATENTVKFRTDTFYLKAGNLLVTNGTATQTYPSPTDITSEISNADLTSGTNGTSTVTDWTTHEETNSDLEYVAVVDEVHLTQNANSTGSNNTYLLQDITGLSATYKDTPLLFTIEAAGAYGLGGSAHTAPFVISIYARESGGAIDLVAQKQVNPGDLLVSNVGTTDVLVEAIIPSTYDGFRIKLELPQQSVGVTTNQVEISGVTLESYQTPAVTINENKIEYYMNPISYVRFDKTGIEIEGGGLKPQKLYVPSYDANFNLTVPEVGFYSMAVADVAGNRRLYLRDSAGDYHYVEFTSL